MISLNSEQINRKQENIRFLKTQLTPTRYMFGLVSKSQDVAGASQVLKLAYRRTLGKCCCTT